ncbi:MAG: ABC transporter substrate-binding protein [Henriciella sp.]|uniref:MlaC/ttg2D family ABC transporter substrate-binding protein n=1 Tax=Henriciella sp. TaxID=1968823 RepID=UPI003C78A4E8
MTDMTGKRIDWLKNGLVASVCSLAVAFAVSPSAYAKAADDDAKQVVSEAVDRTLAALDDAEISTTEADTILELVDVDRVAQFALGNHWDNLSESQKPEYIAAFRTFANNQLQDHLSGFSQAEVAIEDVQARGSDDAIVQTIVTTDDDRQTVSWRLYGSGDWKIVDIEVQNVWFAIEQRAQFDAILDENGGDLDALIAEIAS